MEEAKDEEPRMMISPRFEAFEKGKALTTTDCKNYLNSLGVQVQEEYTDATKKESLITSPEIGLLRLPNMNLKLHVHWLAKPLDKLLLTELGKLCCNCAFLSDQQETLPGHHETLPDHHAELEKRFQAYWIFRDKKRKFLKLPGARRKIPSSHR
ncbi:hypothetical protein DUI87_15348 [Hirundo rustica rustica]|uniref:Uncharacterized protein n=1 Tax=Hirundo rustica rustica TaxID=333673 RepID=A0A3M0KKY9_HIRRU|nr:hypothetical protein DUI87_15348 [Hirundo rustica rustica]